MAARRPRSKVSVPAAEPTAGVKVQRLRRVLTLWDLIFYGVVAVTPSAPATVYGLAELKSGGYVVVTILAAMVAMVLTAISYGRMAALYPSAGSAYAYVSRGIHPYLGFVAGWAMLLDYMLIPLFCTLYGTLALQRALPVLPFPIGSIFFAGGITLLNLRGIRSTARANQVLLVFMGIVLFSFIVLAIKYIAARYGIPGLVFHPAVLPSGYLSPAGDRLGNILRGLDLPGLRRGDDHGRGCERSPKERPAGGRFRMPVYRRVRWAAGLSRPSGVAGLHHLHQRQHRIHRRHRPGRWRHTAQSDSRLIGGRQCGCGADFPGGRGTAALRHGTGECNSRPLFCPPPPHSQHSRLQHYSARRSGLSSGPSLSVTSWPRNC